MSEQRGFAAPDPGIGPKQGPGPVPGRGPAGPAPAWGPPAGPAGASPGFSGYPPPPGAAGAGGYGPPPGALYPPPPVGAGGYPLLVAPRPGTTPLRPLTLGDMYDGAFKTLRRYPAATLGSAAIVAAASGVFMVLSQAVQFMGDSQSLLSGVGFLVGYLLLVVLTSLLGGVLVTPVERGLLGLTCSFGDAWRAALSRTLPLLACTLLVALWVGGVTVLLVGPPIVLGILVDPMWFLLLILTAPGALVITLAGATRVLLGTPIVVAETCGPIAALHRSWELTRGAFWRTLGIVLLAYLITSVISGVLAVPFAIIGSIFLVGQVSDPESGLAWGYFAFNAVGNILAATVSYPFMAGVIALLYYDQRFRKEGLDVELARRAQAR